MLGVSRKRPRRTQTPSKAVGVRRGSYSPRRFLDDSQTIPWRRPRVQPPERPEPPQPQELPELPELPEPQEPREPPQGPERPEPQGPQERPETPSCLRSFRHLPSSSCHRRQCDRPGCDRVAAAA